MICIDGNRIVLNNFLIERVLELNNRGLATVSCRNHRTGQEYLKRTGFEFAFTVNDRPVNSFSTAEVCDVDGNVRESKNRTVHLNTEILTPAPDCKQLKINFKLEEPPLLFSVNYLIYEGSPGWRKFLEFEALTDDILLEKVSFEDTVFAPGGIPECDFYHGADNIPEPINVSHDGDEDLVRCHNPLLNEGFIMGNTAPGPLRFYLIYPHWSNMRNGYSQGAAAFAKHLSKGEKFATDAALLAFYEGALDDPNTVNAFRELVRRGLPPMVNPEGVMYCTWLPFLKNINEQLVKDLMAQASDFGFRYFVLDDGWFDGNDWEVDKVKFPNGLEPLRETAEKLNLKFGLWFNVGTDYGMKEPGYANGAKLADGRYKYSGERIIQCFGSAHRERMLAKLTALVEQYRLDYFKLDFSNIVSPYGVLSWGCHYNNHEHHRGYNDSFIAMYRGMKYMREELKKRFPHLTIDFSFEVFGPARPNIAALEFSELNHVSNYSARDLSVTNIVKVRKSFYQWSGMLPPERILYGLLTIREERGDEYLLTSFMGAPLVAGDLRELSPELRAKLQLYTQTFHELSAEAPLTEYEIVANEPGFDGFRRYNAKTGKGFLCLFNRTDLPQSLDTIHSFVNVSTNEVTTEVPPNSCAMFRMV